MNMQRPVFSKPACEGGFTLIEMMISMAMGLILIAGLASVFTSLGRTSSTVSSQTERMGDLYLMSQVMQGELRLSRKLQDVNNSVLANLTARGVNIAGKIPGYPAVDAVFVTLPYWHQATRTLTYQNIDGDVGVFCYQYSSNDSVYWLRANASISRFDELSRNLDVLKGMCALDANGVCTTVDMADATSIKLVAAYLNQSHQSRPLSLSFLAWPRN